MKKAIILTLALVGSLTALKAQQLPKEVKVPLQSIVTLNNKVDSLSRILSGSVLPGNQIQSFLGALYGGVSTINAEAQRSIKLYQDSLGRVKPVIKKP